MFPWNNNNYYRRKWRYCSTRTLTLLIAFPNGWEEFKEISKIEDNETNKIFFDILYNLYGDMYTKPSVKEILAKRLAYYIKEASVKYAKIKELWEDETGKKFGSFEETKLFAIGELTQSQIDETGGYDKRQTGRQTYLKEEDILNKINNIINRDTPIQALVKQLKKQLFTPYQKGYEVIMEGGIYGN